MFLGFFFEGVLGFFFGFCLKGFLGGSGFSVL